MTVDTCADQALRRVVEETDRVSDKLAAFRRFHEGVSSMETRSQSWSNQQASRIRKAVASGSFPRLSGGGRRNEDRCTKVRELFAETVYPHSTEDVDEPETPTEALREELGDEITVALSGGDDSSGAGFTPELKKAVLSATTKRQDELQAMRKALEKEESSVRSALEVIDEVTGWIVRADETSLLSLDFDELQERHERLVEYTRRCEAVMHERQEVLHGSTSRGAAGVRHHDMIGYLYQDMPTEYPVLYTVTRLNSLCSECRESVRDHLTRCA